MKLHLTSQRMALRTPYFTIHIESLLVLLTMALLIVVFTASASEASEPSVTTWSTKVSAPESVLLAQNTTTTTTKKRVRKSTTTIATVHEDGDDIPADVSADVPSSTTTTSESASEEGEVTTTFGSRATTGTAGCKTEELNKTVIRDLKSDCKAWVKDQRADLKGKFNTSKCEESCTDCGMSLTRCTVTGTVKYKK